MRGSYGYQVRNDQSSLKISGIRGQSGRKEQGQIRVVEQNDQKFSGRSVKVVKSV